MRTLEPAAAVVVAVAVVVWVEDGTDECWGKSLCTLCPWLTSLPGWVSLVVVAPLAPCCFSPSYGLLDHLKKLSSSSKLVG